MKKYLQNHIAESPLTLPVAVIVTMIVWLTAGLLTHQWWIQLACLTASVYLMVELSNNNALLRVRSRMVTSVFLVFSSCLAAYLSSLPGAIVLLCFAASFLLMFQTYQDQKAVGLTFYAYLFIGISSFFWAQSFLFVPFFWLLCLTQLQSLSVRTWTASILGLLTPYWFILPWMLHKQQPDLVIHHFAQLFVPENFLNHSLLSVGDKSTFALAMVLFVLAFLHFRSRSFEDRIRIRQLYGFFAWITLVATVFLLAQPQFYDPLMRIIIICVSPYVAHFFTLTSSRVTNLVFIVSCILMIAIIGLNLFELLSADFIKTPVSPWNGLLTF